MSAVPSALQAHYDTGATTTALALRITRADGLVVGLTGAGIETTIAGVTYQPGPGLDASQLASSAGMAVDQLEMAVLDDDTVFTRVDVLNGLWRNAAFLFFRYNWSTPPATLADAELLLAGTLGNVTLQRGQVVCELRGLVQYLQQDIGNITSRTCRARLADYPTPAGNNRCRLDVADWSTEITVSSVTDRRRFVAAAPSGDPDGDPNYADVTVAFHADGADNSTTFTPVKPCTVTVSGTAKISTAQSVFGGASARCDGGGYIKVAYSAGLLSLGGAQYSLAVRFRFDSVPGSDQVLCGQNDYGSSGEWDLRLRTDAKLQLTAPSGAAIVVTGTLSANTWYALLVTDDGTTTRMFVDGTLVSSSATRITGSTRDLGIGAATNGNAKFVGYWDEFRLWVGVATHTATYTLETVAFSDAAGPTPDVPDDYYGSGVVKFLTGANAGVTMKVKAYSAAGEFELLAPLAADIAEGDTLLAVAGCRGRLAEDCVAKFANAVNFAGEPHLPGVDALLSVPEAQV